MWPEVRPGRPGSRSRGPGAGNREKAGPEKTVCRCLSTEPKMCRSHPTVRKSLPNRHISRDKLEKMV